MTQKRSLVYMLITIATVCFLAGCNNPYSAQANTPTTGPAISGAATPTPKSIKDIVVPTPTGGVSSEATATPSPSPSPTETPTPTPTPSPTPTPTPIPTVPPAPVAVNTDTTTIDFLINRDYPLTDEYRPDDLVVPDIPFGFTDKTLDKRKLKKIAAEALEELYAAALAEEGLTIYGISGYRSFDRQYDIYGANLITKGIRHTNLYSAAPGNSEHQTGLAIDVSCQSIGFALVDRFENTPEGIWLKDNCWRFGFILRYPKDKEAITGYAYEPWHIRYVGVPLAYYLYTNNLTLEEYYGSPSSHTLAELKDRPLIDMHTERFYKLYAATFGSELIYLGDGTILRSKSTGFPHLKEYIRDAAGKAIRVNGTALPVEPVLDADGNYLYNDDGNFYYTKPYFDADGNLWLDYSGSPVFLQPLWNADGTLATDADGNILYTEPERDLAGMELISETGALYQKVPVRDENGELTFHPDGTVCFYEPFVNPISGEYILDTSTGLPLYPYRYYEIPHNTYPLPEEYLYTEELPQEPFEEPFEDPSGDSWFPGDEAVPSAPEDSYYDDTTDETGGFFG